MLIRKQYPTKSRLLELFEYHPDGFLIRKSTGKANGVSGEYAKISIDNESYSVHKCIFIMHQPYETYEECIKAFQFGHWLTKCAGTLSFQAQTFKYWEEDYVIDHFDHDKHNNRLENLRLITMKENYERSPKTTKSWGQFRYALYRSKNPVDIDAI
jgi:hypothetical protein